MGAIELISGNMPSLDLWLTPTLLWVLVLVFGWAGIAKLVQPRSIGATLRARGIRYSLLVAQLIGLGEVLIAGAIVLAPRLGASVATVMLAIYTAFVISQLGQAHALSCNCFGGSDAPISRYTLLRNLALLSAASMVIVWQPAGAILAIAPLASALALPGIGSLLLAARDTLGMSRALVDTMSQP